MKKGFTLIEMLVVIGIIAILIGASLAGYSSMVKTADKARCQELVSNVATALTMLFQNEGMWPKRLAKNGATDVPQAREKGTPSIPSERRRAERNSVSSSRIMPTAFSNCVCSS